MTDLPAAPRPGTPFAPHRAGTPGPGAAGPVGAESGGAETSAVAYQRLREDILSLELRPGEVLTEARLCGLLQTSRTTVRGALLRLANEGLVRKAGRSYTVSPIDIPEIEQLFAYREILEVGALQMAFARTGESRSGHAAALARVRERVCAFDDHTPMDEYMRLATRFHMDLAELSGNAFMVRALEDVLLRLARARWLEAWGSEGRARSHGDHLWLLALLEDGQQEAACQHIRQHLRRSCDSLVAALHGGQRALRLHGLAVGP